MNDDETSGQKSDRRYSQEVFATIHTRENFTVTTLSHVVLLNMNFLDALATGITREEHHGESWHCNQDSFNLENKTKSSLYCKAQLNS